MDEVILFLPLVNFDLIIFRYFFWWRVKNNKNTRKAKSYENRAKLLPKK